MFFKLYCFQILCVRWLTVIRGTFPSLCTLFSRKLPLSNRNVRFPNCCVDKSPSALGVNHSLVKTTIWKQGHNYLVVTLTQAGFDLLHNLCPPWSIQDRTSPFCWLQNFTNLLPHHLFRNLTHVLLLSKHSSETFLGIRLSSTSIHSTRPAHRSLWFADLTAPTSVTVRLNEH